MMRALAMTGLLALAACSQPAQHHAEQTPLPPPVQTDAPAGAYTLDPAHGSLIFRVEHMGFSRFTARFAHWDAELNLDPAHPEAASVTATIDPASIQSDNPPAGFIEMLAGPEWLDTRDFPRMTFRSTRVERTGADTARVVGDLSFHGQTHPVTLNVKFNGGYPGMALDPHARIGFSANGVLSRSQFGLAVGLPPAGTKFGVGDQVAFEIEAELSGPAWRPPSAS